MSQQTPNAAPAGQTGQNPPKIAERAILVKGLRVAAAMSDGPRALLAHVPVIVLPEVGFVWQDYATILDQYAPERRVFALDWPGFGASDKPTLADFDYTTDALAETFGGWLDGLGIARGVVVAGGIGAEVALRFAAAHPRRVAGLALVAPVGFGGATPSNRILSWLLGRPGVLRRVEALTTSLALGPTNDATRAVAERHHMLRTVEDGRDTSRAAMAALWRSALRPADLAEVAKQVQAPAQVFRGALDPLVTADEARRAAETVGGRGALEVSLPEAGHLPFLQQPDRFFQALTGLIHTAELAAAQLS